MLRSEILHRAGPVNVRQQPRVTQAQFFYGFSRWEIKDFFQCSLRSLKRFHSLPCDDRSRKQRYQKHCANDSDFAVMHHLRLRRSKINTAAAVTAME